MVINVKFPKELVYMNVLALFRHHVIPKLHDFLTSMEHKKRCLAERAECSFRSEWGQMLSNSKNKRP